MIKPKKIGLLMRDRQEKNSKGRKKAGRVGGRKDDRRRWRWSKSGSGNMGSQERG